MLFLNKRFYLFLIIILVLLAIILYFIRKKQTPTIYSEDGLCGICKSKNIEIKEKSCFTNKNIRTINNKISSIKIPDNFPFLLVLVFAVPVYIMFLFKMWYYYFELIGNYLLMFIFPEKYKEKKMFCYCKDCGKVSIIQE